MVYRRLTSNLPDVSLIGYGAFKLGRNEKIKYAQDYALPSDEAAARLIDEALALGINYFDTAPAYGLSEPRLGRFLSGREGVVISTKVGEQFADGRSTYDFSAAAVEQSIEQSLRALQRDALDLVFVHSDGRDLEIVTSMDVVPKLQRLRERGWIRALGFSGKTPVGAAAACVWADALMIEYHLLDRSHEDVLAQAQAHGIGIVIKKGLAAGRLAAAEAVPFLARHPAVSSVVISSLNVRHLEENITHAEAAVAG